MICYECMTGGRRADAVGTCRCGVHLCLDHHVAAAGRTTGGTAIGCSHFAPVRTARRRRRRRGWWAPAIA